MSRARKRREAARMKRQVPDHFPGVKKMLGDDDSEQFDWMDDWMDVEQPEDMYAGEDLEGDGW